MPQVAVSVGAGEEGVRARDWLLPWRDSECNSEIFPPQLWFLLYGSVRLCALVQQHHVHLYSNPLCVHECLYTSVLPKRSEMFAFFITTGNNLTGVWASSRSEKPCSHTLLLNSHLNRLQSHVLSFVACMYVFNILTISARRHTLWRSMLLILQTCCLGNPEVQASCQLVNTMCTDTCMRQCACVRWTRLRNSGNRPSTCCVACLLCCCQDSDRFKM